MKLYRVISYVLNLNGDAETQNLVKFAIESNRYPEFITVTDVQETDCGEWHDNHELNKHIPNYDKYFPDINPGPSDVYLKAEYQRVRQIMLNQINRNIALENENRNLQDELAKLTKVQEFVQGFKDVLK